MTTEAFIQFCLRERHATAYESGELATIIATLDTWIRKGQPRRIVNPTTRPRRVFATFDVAAMRALRTTAAEAFEMRE